MQLLPGIFLALPGSCDSRIAAIPHSVNNPAPGQRRSPNRSTAIPLKQWWKIIELNLKIFIENVDIVRIYFYQMSVSIARIISAVIAAARSRIRNGEITERLLARRIGISQAHMNNILKGARSPSPDVADRLIRYFALSAEEIAPPDPRL
jgi:hypothetical protein